MIQSNSPSLVKSLKESSSTGNSNNNPDQDPQIGADDEGRRKSTPLIDYTMTYTKCKKRSLGAEDHFQYNNHQMEPKFVENMLGINSSQKEIGPALTPLIDESNQDQLDSEIDKLIQVSKSLAGSLYKMNNNHIDKNLVDTQNLNRSIVNSYQSHHQTQENLQGYSMMMSGILLFVSSSLLWIIGIPILLFDLDNFTNNLGDNNPDYYLTNSSVLGWLDWLLIKIFCDQHYKYFITLQITFGLVFVVINWGGLKIFRHS